MRPSARFLTALFLIACGVFSGSVAVTQDVQEQIDIDEQIELEEFSEAESVLRESPAPRPAFADPGRLDPPEAKAQESVTEFMLLLTSKPIPVPRVSENWQTIERRDPQRRRVVRTSATTTNPEGVVRVYCQGATIATDMQGKKLDYKIECTGKLRLENNGTIITCSGLKYEGGYLVLADVTIRKEGQQEGLLMEMQAERLKIKYPVAFVSMQRADSANKEVNEGTSLQPTPEYGF